MSPASPHQGTRWLSREFCELLARPVLWREAPDAHAAAFDVIVVGTGYGGAIAAAHVAGSRDDGRAVTVCVLERGREYLPGSFPARMAELPAHLRGTLGDLRRGGEGLFDIRADGDIAVVLANGLGGGSLINAGVMEMPAPAIFDERWPAALRARSELDGYYARARELLGAADGSGLNTISRHARHRDELPRKTRLLRSLAPGSFRETAITVAMTDKVTAGGVQLNACRRCGDCATGCNYGAKESLDTNLIARAVAQGAELYCGATALEVRRSGGDPGLWCLRVTPTDEKARLREGPAKWIAARKVVLAAGALGSTEILLRSQQGAPAPLFSPQLGQRFSSNGDLISFGYAHTDEANAVADEDVVPDARDVGPTITGVIDPGTREVGQGVGVVEELAVPGPLRRAFEEALATADALHALGRFDGSFHVRRRPRNDPYAVHPGTTRRTSIFATMGDDGGRGTLRLVAPKEPALHGDGLLRVVWPGASKERIFGALAERVESLTARAGGRTIHNPLWQLLPRELGFLLDDQHGLLTTVHPLGGCAMGDDARSGVVDDHGRVFDARALASDPRRVHDGLFVLDGAILPSALRTNPALTIAALGLRAITRLLQEWAWTAPAPKGLPPQPRPVLDDVAAAIAARPPARTEVEATERLAGKVRLRTDRCRWRDYWAEVTLTYRPLDVSALFRPRAAGRLDGARLEVAPGAGTLRLFTLEDWERLRSGALSALDAERLRQESPRTFALAGHLILLRRRPTTPVGRAVRALAAWLLNRGAREVVQGLTERLHRWVHGRPDDSPPMLRLLLGALKLATRAGEIRLFEYELAVGAESTPPDAGRRVRLARPFTGRMAGRKRITYGRPSNPWRQLLELDLTQLPLGRPFQRPRLELDPQFFAERKQPLLRITAQRDHVEALADLVSLGAYFLRMLISIHIWNAPKPDAPRARELQRLPGPLAGLPEPEVHTLEVDTGASRAPIRLTRYARSDRPRGRPVLLIHGYSASGTTFAHPALAPSLAGELANAGRDVWVADLRSSAGLPTATRPWSMERIALVDIPAAIEYVHRQVGCQAVDVVAHCMGAVMLSMALLAADRRTGELVTGRDDDLDPGQCPVRLALPERVGRVVLSQNGPLMVLSRQNTLRAYVLSFMEDLVGPLEYSFRPEPREPLGWQLLDRLLATMPYPDDELLLEQSCNPRANLEHLGTRHRMDALYGRTFTLGNLSPAVLAHIDDFFGPLNLDTVAQAIHFAQHQCITNRDGRNRFVTREAMARLWKYRTLVVHGQHNGLADVATLGRIEALMKDAGCAFDAHVVAGHGHQDCLIGRDAGTTLARIRAFLDDGQPPARPAAPFRYRADPPWLGPMRLHGDDGQDYVGLGANPRLGKPELLCWLPVRRDNGRWQLDEATLHQLPPDFDLGFPRGVVVDLVEGPRETDWFTEPLPSWIRALRVEHVLVLLLYPQGELRDVPAAARCSSTWRDLCALTRSPREIDAMAAEFGRAFAHLDGTGAGSLPEGILEFAPAADSGGRLLFGSCQYPPGIVNLGPGFAAWERLDVQLRDPARRTDLLVLTGDQIYADATAGLFDPALLDDRYRKPYESWLRNEHVRSVMRRVPVAAMLDDHEIDDNWEPISPQAPAGIVRERADRGNRGVAAFRHFLRQPDAAAALWFAGTAGQIPFFLMDTRTERRLRSATAPGALMAEVQWRAFEAWLCDARHRDLPKVVATPPLLLPRHRRAVPATLVSGPEAGAPGALRSDSWGGYPHELARLLTLILDRNVRRLVLVSGDEHLGLFTTVTLSAADGRTATVHSLHSPGLNTPYRFANAAPADFVREESFGFGPGRTCGVRTELYEGAGFVAVALQRRGDAWDLTYEFPGRARTTIPL